jgi:hypothetical protein
VSWASHHRTSERHAAEAEAAARYGDADRALALYRLSAEAETAALDALDASKQRTFGITALSSVALWYRAQEYSMAESLAYRALASGTLPDFAKEEIRQLLQLAWSRKAQESAGVSFIGGDVLVSVKGGKVVFGGAPLDLILRKVEEVQALFFRTIELLLGVPHRHRGAPSAQVQSVFQPWLFQAPPGSYQFAVRVQEPPQTELFPDAAVQVQEVVSTFLSIVKASVMDPEGQLKQLVPDPKYQETFLKLTRNLAPSAGGERFGQIEFRDATQVFPEPVALSPDARSELNRAIRARVPKREPQEGQREEQVEGVLRAVHLDEHWLEVALPGREEHIKIVQTAEVLEDVVGPLVNQKVIVEVTVDRRGRHIFRDIQPAE